MPSAEGGSTWPTIPGPRRGCRHAQQRMLLQEEKLILAFAPDGPSPILDMLAQRLPCIGLHGNAAAFSRVHNICSWASSINDPEKQSAALNYVLKGTRATLGDDLAGSVQPGCRSLLRAVLRSACSGGPVPGSSTLLGRLYPEEQRNGGPSISTGNGGQDSRRSSDGRVDATTFLRRLHELVGNEASAERSPVGL